ncbi:MAG: hypothetical protein AB7T27_10960 [Kiritimatiellia bacterium]
MNRILQVNIRMAHLMLAVLALFAYLVIFIPFFLQIAGDAQVHLAVAERFVEGHPFTYNADEVVVASTSPFWTLMLVALMMMSGSAAVLFLKILCSTIYFLIALLLWHVAGRYFSVRQRFARLLLVLWLFCVPVLANALSGLENILSAFQVLSSLVLAAGCARSAKQSVAGGAAMGLLLGWALLTRPDGGALCLLVFALYFLYRMVVLRGWLDGIAGVAVCAVFAVLVLYPWYLYQYKITGRVFTDSSLARMYAGRRASITLIPGCLYFHPKALVTLLLFFTPLSLGVVYWVVTLCRIYLSERTDWREHVGRHLIEYLSMAVILAGIAFYTFVVGADHFGRYFLVVFPPFFVAGIRGLDLAELRSRSRIGETTRTMIILLAAGYMLAGSGIDYYRRIIRIKGYGGNLVRVMHADKQREEYTDRLLTHLNCPLTNTARVAVTEVQLRHYVDERIVVLSLDGRTSGKILEYIDPETGMPRFDDYLEAVRPDFVQLGQWSQGQNWFHYLLGYEVPDNRIGQWEMMVKNMKPGDSFVWNGRCVVYVQPDWLHIDWNEKAGPK